MKRIYGCIVVLSLLSANCRVQADEVPKADVAAPKVQDGNEPQKVYRTIPVKYIKPSLMAWWLDPGSHPKPPTCNSERERLPHELMDKNVNPYLDVAPAYGGARSQQKRKVFSPIKDVGPLPDGIEAFVAVDPQNSILVYGTEEGISQFKEIVESLDYPIKQVQVDGRLVKIHREDYNRLVKNAVRLAPVSKPLTAHWVTLADADAKEVEALIASQKAFVVNQFRVTAVDTDFERAFVMTPVPAKVEIQNGSQVWETVISLKRRSGDALSFLSLLQYEVGATIKKDNTLALKLELSHSLVLQKELQKDAMQYMTLSGPNRTSIAFKVRESQMVMIDVENKPESEIKSVLFCSTTIVERLNAIK